MVNRKTTGRRLSSAVRSWRVSDAWRSDPGKGKPQLEARRRDGRRRFCRRRRRFLSLRSRLGRRGTDRSSGPGRRRRNGRAVRARRGGTGQHVRERPPARTSAIVPRRAQQHDAGPVHVRRHGAADAVQRALYRNVSFAPRARARAARRCASFCCIELAAGHFSRRPGRAMSPSRLQQVAEGRTETKTIELKDGRVIALVSRPMRGGGWLATHTDVTDQLLAEKERDALRQRERAAARRSTRRSRRSAHGSRACSKPSVKARRR